MQTLTRFPVTMLHGTAVASVAAARANGTGIVGVFPGAPVLAVGMSPRLTTSEAIAGIAAAVERGARVINMSFGSRDETFGLFVAIADAVSQNVLVVAAAGNDRQKVVAGVRNRVIYPAAWPHVLSVSSIGPAGASSRFSTANGAVEIAAPGERVLAAVPVALDVDGVADGYSRLSGTSLASPIVAGAAAWLMAARPELSAGQVADTLRWTAADIAPEGWDMDTGWGRVDLAKALQEPAPDEDGLEVDDNIAWVDGTHFEDPDEFAFRGSADTVSGTVDAYKDPADVHRIQVPAGTAVKVTLQTGSDENANLAIFSSAARTIHRRRGLIARSFRGVGQPERLTVRNRGRRPATAFVAVYAPRPDADDTEFLDAGYSLTFEPVGRGGG
jgi:subtilisin family serine protease